MYHQNDAVKMHQIHFNETHVKRNTKGFVAPIHCTFALGQSFEAVSCILAFFWTDATIVVLKLYV